MIDRNDVVDGMRRHSGGDASYRPAHWGYRRVLCGGDGTAEEERAAEESAAGAGGATAKDMESAAGVFIAEAALAEVIMIPMGGLCGGPRGW